MIYEIPLNSLDDTQNIAETLAKNLSHQRTGNIFFTGTMGAGKTTFISCLIGALFQNMNLDVPNVTSPTFSIVHEYQLNEIKIAHCDLFRLEHPCELEEIGFDELQEQALCFIEWPENGADYVIDPLLKCDFIVNADNRVLTLSPAKGYSLGEFEKYAIS